MEKKLLEGKVITLPIDAGHVELCDDEGHEIIDESKLPLVYNKDKGVFRILGWTSKMGQVVRIKNVITGEELPYAPMDELKKLAFEYFDTTIGNYKQLPIITEVDYSFLFREKDIVDVPEQNRVRFYKMYYEKDNTEEARERHNDSETVLLRATIAVYYAKLSYTPDEEWDNVIAEADKCRMEVRPVTAHREREKAFWDYIKSNYYPPTKRK